MWQADFGLTPGRAGSRHSSLSMTRRQHGSLVKASSQLRGRHARQMGQPVYGFGKLCCRLVERPFDTSWGGDRKRQYQAGGFHGFQWNPWITDIRDTTRLDHRMRTFFPTYSRVPSNGSPRPSVLLTKSNLLTASSYSLTNKFLFHIVSFIASFSGVSESISLFSFF